MQELLASIMHSQSIQADDASSTKCCDDICADAAFIRETLEMAGLATLKG